MRLHTVPIAGCAFGVAIAFFAPQPPAIRTCEIPTAIVLAVAADGELTWRWDESAFEVLEVIRRVGTRAELRTTVRYRLVEGSGGASAGSTADAARSEAEARLQKRTVVSYRYEGLPDREDTTRASGTGCLAADLREAGKSLRIEIDAFLVETIPSNRRTLGWMPGDRELHRYGVAADWP